MGNCNCCGVCGWSSCDPCLGSVVIDPGACGGMTFTYTPADPCVGVVTEASETDCEFTDCYLDLSCQDNTATQICNKVCDYVYDCDGIADNCASVGEDAITPGGWSWRRTRYQYTVKQWAVLQRFYSYRYTIAFTTPTTMTITVECSEYVNIMPQSYTKFENCVTSWRCGTSSSGCDSGWTDFTCTSDEQGNMSSGAISCAPYNVNRVSQVYSDSDCETYATMTNWIDDENCNDRNPLLDPLMHWHFSGTATYEGTFALSACEDFYDSFTLTRTDGGYGTTETLYIPRTWDIGDNPYFHPDINCECDDACIPVDVELLDCWPATLDITFAAP